MARIPWEPAWTEAPSVGREIGQHLGEDVSTPSRHGSGTLILSKSARCKRRLIRFLRYDRMWNKTLEGLRCHRQLA